MARFRFCGAWRLLLRNHLQDSQCLAPSKAVNHLLQENCIQLTIKFVCLMHDWQRYYENTVSKEVCSTRTARLEKAMSLLSHMREQIEIVTSDGKCLGRMMFVKEPDHIGVVGYKGLVPVKWAIYVDDSIYLSKTLQQILSSWGLSGPEHRNLPPPNIPGTSDRSGESRSARQ